MISQRSKGNIEGGGEGGERVKQNNKIFQLEQLADKIYVNFIS